MDTILRVLLYTLLAIALLAANVWFVRGAWRAIGRGEILLAPFQVVGKEDADGRLGLGLAHLVRARLAEARRRLDVSRDLLPADDPTGTEDALEGPPGQIESPEAIDPLTVTVIRLDPVPLPGGVFDPTPIDLQVGGVEVGGLFAWAQRALVRPRTLAFTVYFSGETAVIAGDLRPLPGVPASNRHLWEECAAEEGEIASTLAYALIQRTATGTDRKRLQALDVREFQTVAEQLYDLAALNSRVLSGRSVAPETWARHLEQLEPFLRQITQWHELRFLIADLAEKAERKDRALDLYREIVAAAGESEGAPGDELVERAEARIAQLLPDDTESPPGVSELDDGRLSAPQRDFLRRMRAFARQVGMSNLEKVAFAETPMQVLAYWNADSGRYEIGERALRQPEMPKYAALMGRFFELHYERCFREGIDQRPATVELWQQFRWALVQFVIGDGDGDVQPLGPSTSGVVTDLLARLTGEGDLGGAKRLAIELLESYGCDWTEENFLAKAREVNRDAGEPVPERLLVPSG